MAELVGEGLSPRTRGNPPRGFLLVADEGSIPAHAGEPRILGRTSSSDRVYPRARGGTPIYALHQCLGQGLSPRTRGNLQILSGSQPGNGSIPAHAGEPGYRSTAHRVWGVYPRARGGTTRQQMTQEYQTGLSPRTRGNH